MAIFAQDIIAAAKVLADDPKNVDDTTGWLRFVNRSIESLWRLLTSLDPYLYFAESSNFTLTSTESGAKKDLSFVGGITGFRVLHGVDLSPGTSSRRTVRRRSFQERNSAAVAWWEPAPMSLDRMYDLRERTLVITPYEAAAGTYRAYATNGPMQFIDPVADPNTLDWQMEQYVEYVELRSAMRALGIGEEDTSELAQDFADVKQEIVEAHTRDDSGAYVIADVEDM